MLPSERDVMVARMRVWASRKAGAMLPPPEVEDAAQEAAIAVWQATGRLRSDVDPWPFLVHVARGALSKYARRYYDRTPPPTPVEDEPTRHDTTESAALSAALGAEVRAVLATLSPRERDAVVLVDLADMPPEDAARSLGLDPKAGALRQARRRAHAKLRESLAHLKEVA